MPPRRRTTAAAKPAPEPEVQDDDLFDDPDADDLGDDDLDLEPEADDDAEPEAEAPKPKRTAKKAGAAKAAPKRETSGFDSAWLATHVNENVDGSNLTARDVRMLLRKMAKNGDLARDVGTDRSRYEFPKGANDPTVRKVIVAVKKGELAAEKKASLEGAKTAAAAKKAPAKKAAPAAKAAPATTRRRRTQA